MLTPEAGWGDETRQRTEGAERQGGGQRGHLPHPGGSAGHARVSGTQVNRPEWELLKCPTEYRSEPTLRTRFLSYVTKGTSIKEKSGQPHSSKLKAPARQRH